MYLSCRVSSLPPPNQQKENKTTQLFHTRTYSANSYTLNIDNTRHTHTTILQLYMYIPKCLCHFLGGALCTGTCMYSSHGNDVECTLCDKFIRTCMYVHLHAHYSCRAQTGMYEPLHGSYMPVCGLQLICWKLS